MGDKIQRIEADNERAMRLLEYLKGEIRDMNIVTRMNFVADLMKYLTPEIEELARDRK